MPLDAATAGNLAGDGQSYELTSWEVLCLVTKVPGFWVVAGLAACQTLAWQVLAQYVLSSAFAEYWNSWAATGGTLTTALVSFLSMCLSPYFGRWSDKHRRAAVFINGACLLTWAIMLFNNVVAFYASLGLYFCFSFCAQNLSGAPILWACLSELLPEDLRETGFGLFYGAMNIAKQVVLIAITQAMSWISREYPDINARNMYLYISVFFTFVYIALVPFLTISERVVAGTSSSCYEQVLAPLRLIMQKPAFRLLCIINMLLAGPEIMSYSVMGNVLFEIFGVTDDYAGQVRVLNWWTTYVGLLAVPLPSLFVGFLGRKIGPAKTLVWLIPFASLCAASPTLLYASRTNLALFFTGGANQFLFTILPQVQAIVPLITPSHRLGEAYGTVSATKQLAAAVGPLIQTPFLSYIAAQGDAGTPLYAYVIAAWALSLLGAWPAAVALNSRLKRDCLDAWSNVGSLISNGSGNQLQA